MRRRLFALLTVAAFLGVSGASSVGAQVPASAAKFGRAAGTDGTFGDGAGEFFDPEKVVRNAAGDVLVADVLNHRIQKFDALGAYLMSWGDFGTGNGQFNSPRGMAIDPATGDVYVVDSLNDRVQVFDSEGAYLRQWGQTGSGDGQFAFPREVALDGSGNAFVTDMNNHRVQKFTTAGTFVTAWGKLGVLDGEFQFPRGIATTPGGDVLVVDSFNHRVQRFDTDGVLLGKFGANGGDGSFGSGDGEFNTPRAVAYDVASALIWVADTGNDRVQFFLDDSVTTFAGKFGTKGLADGELNTPRGLAVGTTASGSPVQYVASSGNHRIDVFDPPELARQPDPSRRGPTVALAPGEETAAALPLEVELLPLGTDPRDLTAVIRYQLAEDATVRLQVETPDGRVLTVLEDAPRAAGVHTVRRPVSPWGRSAGVARVTCRLEAGEQSTLRSVSLP